MLGSSRFRVPKPGTTRSEHHGHQPCAVLGPHPSIMSISRVRGEPKPGRVLAHNLPVWSLRNREPRVVMLWMLSSQFLKARSINGPSGPTERKPWPHKKQPSTYTHEHTSCWSGVKRSTRPKIPAQASPSARPCFWYTGEYRNSREEGLKQGQLNSDEDLVSSRSIVV